MPVQAGGRAQRRRSRALTSAERQVGLGGKRGNADAGQVEPSLVDHEPPLPLRKELAVEQKQIVELEVTLQPQQRPSLEALHGRKLGLGREQRRERGEVEGNPLEAVRAG